MPRVEPKSLVVRWLDTMGILSLPRRLLPSWPRILMYHQFTAVGEARPDGTSADVFRQQLEHIRRHYRPVRLLDLARALAAGDPIAPGSVALTVDDGHASFRRHAMPLLEEYAIPATLFVVSGLADHGWLWTDRFMYLCDVAGGRLALGPGQLSALIARLKKTPPGERDRCLAELEGQAGVEIPQKPPSPYDLLLWEELRALSASPLIDIGSHTKTHPTLSSVDEEQAWDEISGSRRELEHLLEVPVVTFCYPNGSPADYRDEHAAMVSKAGYLCAVATHYGCVRRQSHRFALPRVACHAGDISRFRKAVDGIELVQRQLRGESCW